MTTKSWLKSLRGALCAAAVCLSPVAAFADGEFFQFDISPDTSSTVFTMERGRLSYSGSLSTYTGGADLNASVTYKWVVGETSPVTFRFGPAFQFERFTDAKFGVRAIAEHYRPTSFGHLFFLGELNTIDMAYFGLVTVGFDKPDIDIEFTVQGDNDGYFDQSIGLSVPLAQTQARLRGGYRFQTREVFVGLSINTF